jgi:hypothetical protein
MNFWHKLIAIAKSLGTGSHLGGGHWNPDVTIDSHDLLGSGYCHNHPRRKAYSHCVSCGRWICDACVTRDMENHGRCPDCARQIDPSAKLTSWIDPFGTFVACVNHPEFRATAKCASCGANICELCQHLKGDRVYCAQHKES